MLSVLSGSAPHWWLKYGGTDTLDSYGFSGNLQVIPTTHLRFLESCLDHYETETHFFIHAKYDSHLPLSEQPKEVALWKPLTEEVPPPHCSGKKAILGHTADTSGEIFSLEHLTCIDTYCYGGQWLTALEVETGRLWPANNLGHLRD